MIKLSKQVWRLAWPMILSNITIPLLGMVDTAMVGHAADVQAMATVAIGSVIFDFLFWGFGFLRMSTTGLTAQSPQKILIFYQGVFIALLCATALLIASPLLQRLGLLFIESDQSTQQNLMQYIHIRLFSAPATLLNYVIIGYCFGRQNTKLPLLLLTITNILAMGLDYLFVWQWHWNSQGIAISNVIAQTTGALIGLFAVYKAYLVKYGKQGDSPNKSEQVKSEATDLGNVTSKTTTPDGFWKELFNKEDMLQLFHLNKDIFIRTLFLISTQTFFTRQSALLGIEFVAVNAILMHMQMLVSYGLDGFAIAAESMIGNAIGQKSLVKFKQRLIDCGSWSLLIALVMSLTYLIFGTQIIKIMTDIPTIQQRADHYLFWIVLLPLVSMPGFLFDGVFIGATWSKPLRNAILFACLFVFLPLWFICQGLGNHGLWLAYTGFMLARGVYLGVKLLGIQSKC